MLRKKGASYQQCFIAPTLVKFYGIGAKGRNASEIHGNRCDCYVYCIYFTNIIMYVLEQDIRDSCFFG